MGQDAKMPPPPDMQLIQHLALDCGAVTDRRRQRTTTRVIAAAAAATMATVLREPQLIADIHTHTDEKTTIRMIAVVTRRYKCRSDINLAWRSVVEAWLSLNVGLLTTFQSCLTSPVQYAERKCAENCNK